MREELMTVKELRAAIKAAKIVLAVPRFGVSESWVKLTKADALGLVKGAKGAATPEEFSMYAGKFGTLTEGTLYLG